MYVIRNFLEYMQQRHKCNKISMCMYIVLKNNLENQTFVFNVYLFEQDKCLNLLHYIFAWSISGCNRVSSVSVILRVSTLPFWSSSESAEIAIHTLKFYSTYSNLYHDSDNKQKY